jgi:hypothetical protein
MNARVRRSIRRMLKTKGSRDIVLTSVEAIRVYLRCFASFQGYSGFRRKWWRNLQDPEILEVERSLQTVVNDARSQCEEAFVDVAALLKVHGVNKIPRREAVPLEANTFIASPLDEDYLDLIELFDRMMPMLEMLEAMKLRSSRETGRERARLKHALHQPLKVARATTSTLRDRFAAVHALPPEPLR